jgi:hypothetical protein
VLLQSEYCAPPLRSALRYLKDISFILMALRNVTAEMSIARAYLSAEKNLPAPGSTETAFAVSRWRCLITLHFRDSWSKSALVSRIVSMFVARGERMVIAGAAAVAGQDEPQARGRWPKGTSGNPSGQHVVEQLGAELYETMRADFDRLNKIDETLLRQASLLLARAQRPKCQPDACIRMTAVAHRIIAALRPHAPPAACNTEPTLADIEEQRAEAAAMAAGEMPALPADVEGEPAAVSEATEGMPDDGEVSL